MYTSITGVITARTTRIAWMFVRIAIVTATAVIRYAVRNPNARKVLRNPIGIGAPDRSANTMTTICRTQFDT